MRRLTFRGDRTTSRLSSKAATSLRFSLALYISAFFIAYLSFALNERSLQLLGVAIGYALGITLNAYPGLLLLGFGLSLLSAMLDPTFFIPKVISYSCLAVAFALGKGVRITRMRGAIGSINADPLLFALTLVNLIQIFLGIGSVGIWGVVRASFFAWDSNYFSVLVMLIYFGFSSQWSIAFFNILLSQSVSGLLAFIILRIRSSLNYVVFILGFAAIYGVYLLQEQSFSFEDQWLHERFTSFSLRSNWALQVLNGELDPDIAPHISLFSGFKKSIFATLAYFFLLLVLGSRTQFMPTLLAMSMAIDVIFGPTSFLVPLLFLRSTRWKTSPTKLQ